LPAPFADDTLAPMIIKKKKKDANAEASRTELVIPATRKLGSCMTHRSDIIWIDASSKKAAILETILAHQGISYFPVCSGTVDSVLGILPARAFLASLQAPQWPGLKALVKKPVYLPETVTAVRALETLAESGSKLAFIIDEYGGVDGIVTRNGLMDELLGDLAPNGETDDPDIFRRDDGSYLVGGQIRIDEIAELFSFPEPGNGNRTYYTLAGYLLSINGSIPKTGDVIEAGGWKYEIVDMDGHRIDKVLVSARSPADGSGAPEDLAGKAGG
jgi:putative hemolysin